MMVFGRKAFLDRQVMAKETFYEVGEHVRH